MARTPQIRYDNFIGINNRAAIERLKPSELREAENVDIENEGRVRRRVGRKKIYAGSEVHSLWSDEAVTLFAQGRYLMRLDGDGAATALRTDLLRNQPVSYESVAGTVYWSNSEQRGRVVQGQALHWGMDAPPAPVVMEASPKALPPGTYMVALTYVDAQGEESPASRHSVVSFTEESSIAVLPPPFPAEAVRANVYITPQNGDVLYFQGVVTTSSALTIVGVDTGRPLRTEYLSPPPAGHIVCHHRGRMYVADGNVVWFSEPYAYSWFNRRRNFYMFPKRITMMVSVEGGLFVSWEGGKTAFIAGETPEKAEEVEADIFPAITGTVTRADAAWFPALETGGKAAIWMTQNGVAVGLSNGQVRYLTEERLALPRGGLGSAMIRAERGTRQYVGMLREQNGQSSNMYASDHVVAEVYRNGVLIE